AQEFGMHHAVERKVGRIARLSGDALARIDARQSRADDLEGGSGNFSFFNRHLPSPLSFVLDLIRKPVPTPDHVRGKLFGITHDPRAAATAAIASTILP